VDKKLNLEYIQSRISTAAAKSNRPVTDITLVAVSKTFPVEDVVTFSDMGLMDFGENKVQELVEKSTSFRHVLPERPIRWHAIGHLQRNKVKDVLETISLFHALDSIRLANTIQDKAEEKGIELPVLVQVNVSGEDSKFGIQPHELDAFMDQIQAFRRVRVRGLMTLASPAENPEEVRPQFIHLRELSDSVKDRFVDPSNPQLSMGMSSDFEVAIEEGATLVRVGSSLFGGRTYLSP